VKKRHINACLHYLRLLSPHVCLSSVLICTRALSTCVPLVRSHLHSHSNACTQTTKPDRTEPAQPVRTEPAILNPATPTHLGFLHPHEPSRPLDCGGVAVRPGHPSDPRRDPALKATPTLVHASHQATTTASAHHHDCDGAAAQPRLWQCHRATMTVPRPRVYPVHTAAPTTTHRWAMQRLHLEKDAMSSPKIGRCGPLSPYTCSNCSKCGIASIATDC
jgi:hypothetical protein